MTTELQVPVVFRVWNTKPCKGDVFALFPTIPADNDGLLCSSYERVGQHGSADYHYCVSQSQPATPLKALSLLYELRKIGHKLRRVNRATRRMHDQRIAEARAQ